MTTYKQWWLIVAVVCWSSAAQNHKACQQSIMANNFQCSRFVFQRKTCMYNPSTTHFSRCPKSWAVGSAWLFNLERQNPIQSVLRMTVGSPHMGLHSQPTRKKAPVESHVIWTSKKTFGLWPPLPAQISQVFHQDTAPSSTFPPPDMPLACDTLPQMSCPQCATPSLSTTDSWWPTSPCPFVCKLVLSFFVLPLQVCV